MKSHEFGIESLVEEEVAGAARDAYYAHMRQKSNEEITSYKKRFDITVLGLRSTRQPVPDDKSQARDKHRLLVFKLISVTK